MSKYLEKFVLPDESVEEKLVLAGMKENGGAYGYIDNTYPCGIFTKKELTELDFDNITILYGGNGSGKSTLLNLITNKLELKRIAPFNSSELFDSYVKKCEVKMAEDDEGFIYKNAPQESRIITSDDIFDYMLLARKNNMDISLETVAQREEYRYLKFGEHLKFEFHDPEKYEKFSKQVEAWNKSLSRRKYLYKHAGKEIKLNSNGETAIDYFDKNLSNDCLYCLDEPENSLSPKFQKELVELIESKARYCGCQFIIATHSPFVLSIPGAKIYDLDSTPVEIKKWWELENTKIYYDFFKEHKELFENFKGEK